MDPDVFWNKDPAAAVDDTDSDEERQRQEELEAELYSKLHYAEHSELQDSGEDTEAQKANTEINTVTKSDNAPPCDQSNNDSSSNKAVVREVLEAKMKSPEEIERDSGKSSLKSVGDSEASSEDINEPSKYDDNKVIDIDDDDNTSESDDGIQIVETVTKTPKVIPKKEPVATVTLDSSSEDDDSEVEIDCQTNTFKKQKRPSLPSQADAYAQFNSQKNSRQKQQPPKLSSSTELNRQQAPPPKQQQKSPRVTVTQENPSKSRKSLSRRASTSSDSSSTSSDSDADTPALSLNISGGRTPKKDDCSACNTFQQVLAAAKAAAEATIAANGGLPLPRVANWSPEMEDFYNGVTQAELESKPLAEIKAEFPGKPGDDLWQVSAADRYSSAMSGGRSPGGSRGRGRYFRRGASLTCHNCNRSGHMAMDCKEPTRIPACHMCGGKDHQVDNEGFGCPQAKCLHCGTPASQYLNRGCSYCKRLRDAECFNCGGRGHTRTTCPDNWRRYHATLSGDSVVVPHKNQLLEKPPAWCCNCAKKGHYSHQCSAYNRSNYPPSVSTVVTYSDPSQPESLNNSLDTSEEGETASVQRKRMMREAKAKRREFLGLGDGEASAAPAKRRKLSSEADHPTNKLEKLNQSLQEMIDDEASSSTTRWRKQKRDRSRKNKSRVQSEDNPNLIPVFSNKKRNNKKKQAKQNKGLDNSFNSSDGPGGQGHHHKKNNRKFSNSSSAYAEANQGPRMMSKMERLLSASKKKQKAANSRQQHSPGTGGGGRGRGQHRGMNKNPWKQW